MSCHVMSCGGLHAYVSPCLRIITSCGMCLHTEREFADRDREYSHSDMHSPSQSPRDRHPSHTPHVMSASTAQLLSQLTPVPATRTLPSYQSRSGNTHTHIYMCVYVWCIYTRHVLRFPSLCVLTYRCLASRSTFPHHRPSSRPYRCQRTSTTHTCCETAAQPVSSESGEPRDARDKAGDGQHACRMSHAGADVASYVSMSLLPDRRHSRTS